MSQTGQSFFNEMLNGSDVRAAYQSLERWHRDMPDELRSLKQHEAEQLFRRVDGQSARLLIDEQVFLLDADRKRRLIRHPRFLKLLEPVQPLDGQDFAHYL